MVNHVRQVSVTKFNITVGSRLGQALEVSRLDLRTFSSVTPSRALDAGDAVSEKKEQGGSVKKREGRPIC